MKAGQLASGGLPPRWLVVSLGPVLVLGALTAFIAVGAGFFGWYQTANRRMMQRVEVRRGANPDIRIAVVRRMIEIIRLYEQQDFEWQSIRFGRNVTLSARAADTEDLEAFLMREFFEIEATPRRTAPR